MQTTIKYEKNRKKSSRKGGWRTEDLGQRAGVRMEGGMDGWKGGGVEGWRRDGVAEG